ncbi:MAG: transcription elongation factor GreA [Candidatus Methylomirabilis sp.]|nr:transcription elongation factor GreA [Deltaproteobacteria bacterium]
MHELPIIKQLKEELQKVERELRVDVPKELQKAAAHGDLRENAEYEAAKHRQSFLQARAAHLSARINTLSSLKLDDIPRGSAGFGSRIHLEDLATGEEAIFELVTPEEVDPRNGKISVSSPIGKALLNKGVGDEVVVSLPSGRKEYEVTEIYTLHDLLFRKADR